MRRLDGKTADLARWPRIALQVYNKRKRVSLQVERTTVRPRSPGPTQQCRVNTQTKAPLASSVTPGGMESSAAIAQFDRKLAAISKLCITVSPAGLKIPQLLARLEINRGENCLHAASSAWATLRGLGISAHDIIVWKTVTLQKCFASIDAQFMCFGRN